jgi:hypothetical protein
VADAARPRRQELNVRSHTGMTGSATHLPFQEKAYRPGSSLSKPRTRPMGTLASSCAGLWVRGADATRRAAFLEIWRMRPPLARVLERLAGRAGPGRWAGRRKTPWGYGTPARHAAHLDAIKRYQRASVMGGALGGMAAGTPLLPAHRPLLNATDPVRASDVLLETSGLRPANAQLLFCGVTST